MNNRRVYDGARRDADTLRFQVAIHCHQHFAAQIVLLKQVAEAKDRRFVRRGGHAKIHSSEALQHSRLIKRTFMLGSDKPNHCCKK